MATGCSEMSTMRKPIVRQNALSECPETYIPECKDSHVTLSSANLNHDPQCHETQNQVQGLTAAPEESQTVELSPTKINKEQLLNRCNKKLAHYGNLLLKRRNNEKIYFHQDTSLKKNASKQQDNQRETRKKDSSDGLPVSSGVLTETSSLENNKEDLKKSPRRTSLDSASGDEGFVNDDVRKCASLSSALIDIPENGACAVPTVKLNDENKTISLTGQEKGAGFRNSKRSSGYGTGGSEEAPEEECFSSVFEGSPSNSDFKHVSENELRPSYKPLSDAGGLLTESGKTEEAVVSSSTNGQRIVELKESSLPYDAPIWNFKQNVNIKPDIRMKYKNGVNRSLSPSEPGNDFFELMRDNPQIPVPEMNTILKSDGSVEGCSRDAEDVDEEIGALRSCDIYRKEDKYHHLLSGFKEEFELLMSEASAPTNGCIEVFDAVDGARTPRAKCLERAVFCKNLTGSCKDVKCVEGQWHILQFKDKIQMKRLPDCNPKIFEFLWSHSKNCTERQCVVPLCDWFHQRASLSLEEHKQWMTRQFLNPITNELAVSTQHVLKNGTFHMVDDNGSDDKELWKTATLEHFSRMGDFCDSNILRVCMHFNQHSGASDKHVVIKKALQTGLNEKNVYLAIKKPSPYLVKSFWCSSELPDDTLLVCSHYHPELMELKSLLYHDVTPDLFLAILRQAAQAAQYLHSLNVVYLSWKCSSLLFDQENTSVKLCNFSHAMVLEQGVVVTSPDNVRLSIDPCFAAPEVLCDGEAVGFYSDVWGLGCLLYEMLHKRKPYPDYCHRSPADIRRMVRQNEIRPTYPEVQPFLFVYCWDPVSAQRITIDGLLELLSDSTDVDR